LIRGEKRKKGEERDLKTQHRETLAEKGGGRARKGRKPEGERTSNDAGRGKLKLCSLVDHLHRSRSKEKRGKKKEEGRTYSGEEKLGCDLLEKQKKEEKGAAADRSLRTTDRQLGGREKKDNAETQRSSTERASTGDSKGRN